MGLEIILGSVFQEKCVKLSSLPGAFEKIRMPCFAGTVD